LVLYCFIWISINFSSMKIENREFRKKLGPCEEDHTKHGKKKRQEKREKMGPNIVGGFIACIGSQMFHTATSFFHRWHHGVCHIELVFIYGKLLYFSRLSRRSYLNI
jgi:hypothetical protein